MATIINADTSNGLELTSDTSGEIELQSAGVTKAKVTANGLQDANGNPLHGGSYRNLIINGDMNIAQRGTSLTGMTNSGGTSYQTVDRFMFGGSGSPFGTWTQSQDTDVPTGQGFANSFKMQCTTSSTDDGQLLFQQRIEGQNLQYIKKGTSNAESLTLSFWVKSNKTGTYIAELKDNDNTRQISYAYTIDSSDTWEKKTITFAGDTTGTFDNDNGRSLDAVFYLKASIALSSGTLNTSWNSTVNANRAVGQVNLADSTSNYINITGVQLEVGEGASDFEHLPYDVQLQRCQRYYNRFGYPFQTPSTGRRIGAGQVPATTVGIVCVPTPTTMRAEPSFDWSNLSLNDVTTNQTITSISTSYQTHGCVTANYNVASGLTRDQPCNLRFSSTSAYLAFISEL